MKFKRIFSAILILLMSAAICLSPVLIYSENGTFSSDSSTVRTNKEDNSDEEDNSDTNSDVKSDKKTREKTREINPYYKDVTERLQNYFGTKVNISNKNNKGKIEIEYYSDEDLQRILEIINL